jgi:hypothetical protein
MSIVSYFISLLFFAFIIARLGRPSIEAQTPTGVHSISNPVFIFVAFCAIFLPLMIASFVGAITAPNPQRRVAGVVFPALVFLVINLVTYLGAANHKPNVNFLLESAASCAVVGIFLYFKWKRQQPKRA